MLLTTGAIALSRKVADERKKKREKRQGLMQVGNSDVAKRAFDAQTSKMIESGSASPDAGINRAGTEIEFEDADNVVVTSPNVPSIGVSSPDVEVQDTRSTSQTNVTSPVQSEKAAIRPGSPYTETPTSTTAMTWQASSSRPRSSTAGSSEPPPYSPGPASSRTALSPSTNPRDTDTNTLATSDTKSIKSMSTNSQGGHGIRVKTKGDDLKSGFPYHPALFDLRIHPDKWESFTHQITESTKFDARDYARMVGSATGVALTGAIATSVWFGRSMNRKIQEEKIKKGIVDESAGGLGDTLKTWNEEYFRQLGVFVHIELSESAMKNPDQRSKAFRKPALFYSDREDRERKTDERKFVLVVTKLDEEGVPSQALNELPGDMDGAVEIGSSGDVNSTIAEAPGDDGNVYVELPAETPPIAKKKLDPPAGYVEMEGNTYVEMSADNTHMMEKLQLEGTLVEADPDAEKSTSPKPVSLEMNTGLYDQETNERDVRG